MNIFLLLPTNTWIFALFSLLSVGPLTFFLFYNNCHTFREINREKRAVTVWGPRYLCSGYLGLVIIGIAAGVISLMLIAEKVEICVQLDVPVRKNSEDIFQSTKMSIRESC